MTTHCVHCDTIFTSNRKDKIFCSRKCRDAHWRTKEAAYLRGYMHRNPVKGLLRAARNRARNRNIPFDISFEDIIIPEHCPILGIKLQSNWGTGHGGKDNSYSLDRIDPTKGYIKGNVQVISHKANSMKFTATKEELLLFAQWINKTYE